MNTRTSPRGRESIAPRLAAGAALLVLLAACATTPPPHLYVLNAAQPPKEGEQPTGNLPRILVAQAQVPEYLDRPQLVEHDGANGLKQFDNDQWAERLSMNVARTVAQNLSRMVPADATIPMSARSAVQYKCQVVISLDDFELNSSTGGEAWLAGRWSILDSNGENELAASAMSIRKKPAGTGIPAAVEAMSQALAEVSGSIADQFKKLRGQCGI